MNVQTDRIHVLHVHVGVTQACPNYRVIILNIELYLYSKYAKQKHLGCKKVQGQSEAALQTGRCNQKL